MVVLYVDKNQIFLRKTELFTSGSVNVNRVSFAFSEDWEGLSKTAVFRQGRKSVSVPLNTDNQCDIPFEVLQEHGAVLYVGVYGARNGETTLPTIWASLGTVQEGAALGPDAHPPTPDLWEQELAKKGDKLEYTEDGALGLYAGDKLLSAVPVVGGEGGPVYQFGHGLKQEGLTVSVDAVDDFSGDNTLPMTAAGVYATVGNIEALLKTI